jgi:hypothetical protein
LILIFRHKTLLGWFRSFLLYVWFLSYWHFLGLDIEPYGWPFRCRGLRRKSAVAFLGEMYSHKKPPACFSLQLADY